MSFVSRSGIANVLQLIAGTLVIIVALGVGFVAGAQYGVYQHHLMNGSVMATLTLKDLQALRTRDLTNLVAAKEIELDGHIATYGTFLEKGTPWLFWPMSDAFAHEAYMASVARYRRTHPIATPIDESRALVEEVLRSIP